MEIHLFRDLIDARIDDRSSTVSLFLLLSCRYYLLLVLAYLEASLTVQLPVLEG